MEQHYNDRTVLRAILSTVLLFLSLVSVEVYASTDIVVAGDDAKPRFIDRFAFKTNAFEWLVTIPNFGVEFDLKNSEYNNMTVGLTAKYNWNTLHKYDNWSAEFNPGPPVVFNLLDIRPEFRYYYRSVKAKPRKKDDRKFSLERFLMERKNPREWRAQYVGAYVNYANYTTKLTRRGYQGQVFGLGASAGYGLPMYEYKKGFVDVELGFSVGLQVCTKDVFIHNPDGFIYMKVEDESKGIHLTPYPVVSELRVAFVWRSKSIKDKVKTDTDRKRVKSYYESRVKPDRLGPFKDLTKEYYDQHLANVYSEWKLPAIMASDSLYRAGYDALLEETREREVQQIATSFPGDMEQHERQDIRDYVQELKIELQELIAKEADKARTAFEKSYEAVKTAAARQEAETKAESKPKKEKVMKKDSTGDLE